MRKLSKKISMLMVLAMLVSLFSGVVSASAASSKWSFYDREAKEVVAKGGTYEMEKNQYANFDLYCEGEEADADTYAYYWESSDENVVYVDKTNGRLRADKYGKAEAGDKAVISVYIDNKTTAKNENAKRSFTIVIADDAEEYTLTTVVGSAVLGAETLVAGKEYALTTTVVDADGAAVEATVAYTVDGKAATTLKLEAGEYTVVATATLDGEVIATRPYSVVVETAEVAIEKVYQKDLDTLCVVFSDAADAKKAADASALDIEKTFELTFNADKDDAKGGDRVDHELFKAAVSKTDETIVEIDAYKPLEENFTYKLAYLEDGKEVAYDWIVGSGKIPYSLAVVNNAEVIVETETDMTWVVKNDKGVEITNWYDRDLYPIEWKILNEDDTDSYVDVNAGTIYFFEKNKSTTVGLVLDMGYDDNGEVADLEAKGVFTSVDKSAAEKPTAYAIVGPTTDPADGNIGWANSFNLYVGEGASDDLALYAKYTKKAADGKESTKYIVAGADEDANEYTYQSSNTDIVAVNEEEGYVYPVAVGTAKIYIKKDGVVIGFATITVHNKIVFSKFDVTADTTKLSVIGDGYKIDEQKINLTAVLKDKLGRNIDLADVAFDWELLSPTAIVSIDGTETEYELDDVFVRTEFAMVDGAIKGAIAADQSVDAPLAVGAGEVLVKNKATKSFRVKFTATYTNADGSETELADYLTFTVKNTTGVDNVTTNLSVPSFNTYLGNLDMLTLAKYAGKIEAKQTDGQGYYIDTVQINDVLVDPEDTISVATGNVTLLITKDNKALGDKAPQFATGTGVDEYALDVNSIWYDTTDTNKLVKADAGSYKVQLFEGTGTKARRIKFANMAVTDEGPAYSVVKLKEWITDYSEIETLGDAVEFKLGTNKIELDDVIITDVTANIDYDSDLSKRVYIYNYELKVNLNELVKELSSGGKSWKADGSSEDTDDYFVVQINFNKTFTVR